MADVRELMEMFPHYIALQASQGVPAAKEILEDYEQWKVRNEKYCPIHGRWECNCKQHSERQQKF